MLHLPTQQEALPMMAPGNPDVCKTHGEAMERKMQVTVCGRPFDVSIRQQGMGLWVASGDYQDREIEAMARSREAALRRWREIAEGAAD
jgi:hypothetical protein